MLTTYCPIVALDTISARSIALAAAQHSLCTLQLGDDTTSCAAAVDWMIHVVLQQLLPTLSLRLLYGFGCAAASALPPHWPCISAFMLLFAALSLRLQILLATGANGS
jgi:hypothetical protein